MLQFWGKKSDDKRQKAVRHNDSSTERRTKLFDFASIGISENSNTMHHAAIAKSSCDLLEIFLSRANGISFV